MPVTDNSLINIVRYAMEYLGFGRWIAPFPIRREARIWRKSDIKVEPGLLVAPPDFVGIGTPKSGTSWWASLIEEHPDVAPNRMNRKEMHYLSHFLERPLTPDAVENYHVVFARPNGKKCGEWTPNYMANPHAVLQLRKAAPDARIMVMLRNPVDRYESGFNHERKQRFGGVIGPGVRMEVLKEYALRTESVWYGMYAAQLEIVFATFPRDQVCVLQYEACSREPERFMRRTYEFLDLDPEFVPENVNRLMNKQRRLRKGLTKEARDVLKYVYRNDVRRLLELCGDDFDISFWPEFEE